MTRNELPLTPEERRRWTRIGTLAALAMVLSYLETFIPIPIPGVKLGLANIAVLIALAERDVSGAFCIGALKVLATGLLFGNPVTMAYSALGTLLAFAVMAPLSRIRGLSIVLVSMAGALAHEAGQLVVAGVLLGTPLVWYSAPLLAVAGCITGALCGIVAAKANAMAVPSSPESDTSLKHDLIMQEVNPVVLIDPRVLFIAFLAYVIVVLHLTTPVALVCALAFAIVACALGRVSAKAVGFALRPILAILVITVIAQVAANPYGTVAFTLGPLAVTAEAVAQSGVMIARLIAIMAASVAVMHLAKVDDLVGAIGWLLAPLERFGVRTAGFTLALNVALSTVPLIVSAAEQHDWTWRDLKEAVPAFVATWTHR